MEPKKIPIKQQINNQWRVLTFGAFTATAAIAAIAFFFSDFAKKSTDIINTYEDNNPHTDDSFNAFIKYLVYDPNQGLKMKVILTTIVLVSSIIIVEKLIRKKYPFDKAEIKKYLQKEAEENPPKTNFIRLFFLLIPLLIGAIIFLYFANLSCAPNCV